MRLRAKLTIVEEFVSYSGEASYMSAYNRASSRVNDGRKLGDCMVAQRASTKRVLMQKVLACLPRRESGCLEMYQSMYFVCGGNKVLI